VSSPSLSGVDQLSLLIDAVDEYAIFMLDRDGYVLTWNSGANRIKGYTADEIVGRHFSAFYPGEDVADGKPQRELDIASECGHFREVGWRVRRDGSRFLANVVITAILDDNHDVVGFAKVTRDDTDRMLAHEREQELALLAERERISIGLCDSIVHRIFETGLVLDSTLGLVHDLDAATHINHAIELLDETVREIRDVLADYQLRPDRTLDGPA